MSDKDIFERNKSNEQLAMYSAFCETKELLDKFVVKLESGTLNTIYLAEKINDYIYSDIYIADHQYNWEYIFGWIAIFAEGEEVRLYLQRDNSECGDMTLSESDLEEILQFIRKFKEEYKKAYMHLEDNKNE